MLERLNFKSAFFLEGKEVTRMEIKDLLDLIFSGGTFVLALLTYFKKK